ncbi:MAG: NYN domain-containing protein [Planctomycetota bacterium]
MLLVDAYNVLHAPGAASLLPDEADAGELASLVAVSRWRRRGPLLVCDGGPRPGGLGPAARTVAEFRYEVERVQILFAGPGRDADSLIETLIDRNTAPARLEVVSSDRRLIRAAKRRRARSISGPAFLRMLEADAAAAARAWRRPSFAQRVPLPPDQVRYWATLLGVAELDVPQEPESPAVTRPVEPRPAEPTAPKVEPDPASATRRSDPADDPLIREALEEWRGSLHVDDLHMERWLADSDTPDPSSRSRSRSPRRPR